MHSAGLELTKLTYTRLEDNLIRHRGDRVHHNIDYSSSYYLFLFRTYLWFLSVLPTFHSCLIFLHHVLQYTTYLSFVLFSSLFYFSSFYFSSSFEGTFTVFPRNLLTYS